MKIKNCPNCDSPRIAKIVYGLPNYNDKMAKDISEEKIVFGGCCVTDNDPDFQCVECGALIFSKTGKFYFNEEEDF